LRTQTQDETQIGQRMANLSNRVAVITGGCDGIGRAAVRRFVADGAKVVVADIQDDKGAALERELGPAVTFCHCDVRDEDAMASAVQRAADAFGGLDIMYHNAALPGTQAHHWTRCRLTSGATRTTSS
jgi:NAD(P)-dependent dehydrogenase (short-subunit alcohol dehydrogenase family)